MTNLKKLKNELLFSFVSECANGYIVDGLVFVDESLSEYRLIRSNEYYPLDFNNLSHINGLLENSKYPKVLPENYHLKNNLGKFSNSDLYFLVVGDNVKIGMSTDVDMRINSFKTAMPCEFKAYYIEGKGFLEKTMHQAFSDFHQKGEWFTYNKRFEKFIKENALLINHNNFEVAPHIDSYVFDFGAYKGYDVKEAMALDYKYCKEIAMCGKLPSKINRFILLGKK